MSTKLYSLKQIRATAYKKTSWFEYFIFDRIVVPVLFVISNYTEIHPNYLTVTSLLLGLISAFCFFVGSYFWAALFYLSSFLCDCLDGRLARLKQNTSDYGAWLDLIVDRLVFGLIIVSYCYSLSVASGNTAYPFYGYFILLFLSLGDISTLLIYSKKKEGKDLGGISDHIMDNIINKYSLLNSYVAFTKRRKLQLLPIELIEIEVYLFVISPWLAKFDVVFNTAFILVIVVLGLKWTLMPISFWKKETKNRQ